jgi:AraC-like DNA-binding protein
MPRSRPRICANYLSVFYEFRADLPVFEDQGHVPISRSSASCSPAIRHLSLRRRPRAAPRRRSQIVGADHGQRPMSMSSGPIHLFGAGILPAGWGALLGFEASTLVNRVIDATHLFGNALNDVMADALRAAPIAGGEGRHRQSALARMPAGAADSARPRSDFTRVVDEWLAASIAHARQVGASRRRGSACRAARSSASARRYYGAPPKLLARKYRALRAAVALVSESQSVDDLIARGFYDQSHLIREVKQFTGHTPRQIKAEPSLLSQLTISQRVALGGQVSPLISDT